MGVERRVVGDRYELVEAIGGGSYGSVWIAWDHRASEWVAVKILRDTGEQALQRFIREQSIDLDDAHIAGPLDVGFDSNSAYIVLRLVRGGTLADLIADEAPLPPGAVAEILCQLVGALRLVHAGGIVHRDVQPANILLDPTEADGGPPSAYLCDFGFAFRPGGPRLSASDLIPGTAGYRAPEICCRLDTTAAADVFSLGAVAYEALTGQRVSHSSEAHPPNHALRFTEPTELPHDTIAPDTWALLRTLLDPDPAQRPPLDAIEHALGAIPAEPVTVLVHTRPPDRPPQHLRTSSARTARLIAALVVVVLVGGTSAAFALSSSGGNRRGSTASAAIRPPTTRIHRAEPHDTRTATTTATHGMPAARSAPSTPTTASAPPTSGSSRPSPAGTPSASPGPPSMPGTTVANASLSPPTTSTSNTTTTVPAGPTYPPQPKGRFLGGGISEDGYCQALGFIRSQLTKPELGTGHAYNNWECVPDHLFSQTEMDAGCVWGYQVKGAVAWPTNPDDAYTWECYAYR